MYCLDLKIIVSSFLLPVLLDVLIPIEYAKKFAHAYHGQGKPDIETIGHLIQ